MQNFDLKSLETLLRHFYNLTKIKACIYDADGNELCYYPSRLSPFCELLREDPTTNEQCKECDRRALEVCRTTRSQYSYTCHAGLRECVSPILCEDNVVGYIMIGQIKNRDTLPLTKALPTEKKAALCAAYEGLSDISEENLDAAMHILDACSGYEALKMQLQSYRTSIDTQIDDYIHKNLTAQISVSALCSEFRLSRHEIYAICNKYFGTSPAEYIKKCRLAHACHLLTTTALPIGRIATLCGIPDYNYFSKVFKASIGISPSQYKKRQTTSKG